MNYSTLQPSSYTTPLYDSSFNQQWKGQRSSKFPPSIRHLPVKDLIRSNFQLPDQTPRRGRSHFYEPSSLEKPFRSSIHKVPPIEHWHLRESSIRTMRFKPTEKSPRAEQRHNIQLPHNPQSPRMQSLRTFYLANAKTEREYGIQDRMQRKVRINQVQLRKSFYQNLDIFGRK